MWDGSGSFTGITHLKQIHIITYTKVQLGVHQWRGRVQSTPTHYRRLTTVLEVTLRAPHMVVGGVTCLTGTQWTTGQPMMAMTHAH